MGYVDRIIAKWPSMAAFSRALGHSNPTTVQGWKDRGVIPARQQQKVIEAGQADGIAIGPQDFFNLPGDPAPSAQVESVA